MRIHHLEIEAMGPFSDRVTVDVDALSAEGLFLIHGPTGSGKTSLLDAICFALYADVPGARSKRGLRSDHAAPHAVPRVTLELTAGLRRLRVTRSPEFSRPKKRGSGMSSVQATVTLEEHLDGQWVALSTRHDEVADVVKDVLGMGMAQFAKVVLLPQGEFAAFLRSTPDERREVLERLFDISAFSDVEAWLAQARRDAGADLERARSQLATGLARVEDVLADLARPRGEEPPQALPCDPTVGSRLASLLADLDHRVTTTMAAFDTASIAERVAAEVLAEGRAVAALRARGARAQDRLDELALAEPEHELRQHALVEAERAAALAGHLAAHDRAEADVDAARSAVERSRASLAPSPLASAPDVEVEELLRRVHDLDATVAELVRHHEAATARSDRRLALTSRLGELTTARAEAEDLVAAGEAERDDLEALVRQHAAGAGRIAELELLFAGAHDRVAVLDAADLDLASARDLAPRHLALREAVLDARTHLLDLRQRRLDDMAAELAQGLEDGEPCPVCGGVEHPEPASAIDPVSADQLAAAETRVDDLSTQLRGVEVEIDGLTTSATTRLDALGGATRDVLEADVATRAEELASARAEARTHALLETRLARVRATLESDRARLTATIAHTESTAALLGELDDQDEADVSVVGELRALHATCPCGAEAPADHDRLARRLSDHRSAVEVLAGAGRRAAVAATALDQALAASGFTGREQARPAVRAPEEVALLRAQVATHEEDRTAARSVIADADIAAALAAEPVDLEALQLAEQSARSDVLAAAAARDDVARGVRALERLVPEVQAACTAVAAAQSHDARVRDLADTTSGTGPDNTLRMRLTAYVLAARLEKVAGLANERLAVMGGGRFVLEHSDERAARGARSGLGLRVLDQWTGRVRDTSTLSGGESFMASLALALGLADAVREESGGLDLGTLFIDEGFGSLDDDSLEQVLTVLDGLREGGRAVGVVSHVADLRARITHQAVVHKGASGSTVEVRVGSRSDQPAA